MSQDWMETVYDKVSDKYKDTTPPDANGIYSIRKADTEMTDSQTIATAYGDLGRIAFEVQ